MAGATLAETPGSLHRGLSFELTGPPIRRALSFENTAPSALRSSQVTELQQLNTCHYDFEDELGQFDTEELKQYLRKQCHQSQWQLYHLKHHGGDMDAITMASDIHCANLLLLSKCIERGKELAKLKKLNVGICVFGQ
jgi:hypothetical protein